MAFSNKLHNPTPFKVNFNYHKGINFVIDPFSHIDLKMEYVEDFVKDRPGYENVYNEIVMYGVFLEDPNRSYEAQALEALKASLQVREQMVKDVTDNIRKSMAAMGNSFTPEIVDEQLKLSGVFRIQQENKELKELVSVYANVVEQQNPVSSVKTYDLTKTIVVVNPPKEFPTKEAMNFFLSKHPDIKQKHEEYVKSMNPEAKRPGRPKTDKEGINEQSN